MAGPFARKKAATPTLELNEAADKPLVPKKRRGLFGRKNNNHSADDRSSDDHEEAAALPQPTKKGTIMSLSKPRTVSPLKRRLQRDAKETATPPVTPEKTTEREDSPPLQVKVVTVKALLSSPPRGRSPGDGESNGENDSVMSDLTDNRTYKRLAQYKDNLEREQVVAAAARAAKANSGGEQHPHQQQLSSVPEEKIASVKARLEKVQAAQMNEDADNTIETETSHPVKESTEKEASLNPMTFLLSYMDHACTSPPQPNTVPRTYSFVPEWGMAPSRDEREKDDTGILAQKQDRGATTLAVAPTEDSTTLPPEGPSRTLHPTAPRDEVHENFEMVLEDLQSSEDHLVVQKKQQRNWIGAMAFRKHVPADPTSPELSAKEAEEDRAVEPKFEKVTTTTTALSPEQHAEAGPFAMGPSRDGLPGKMLSQPTVEEEEKKEEDDSSGKPAKEGAARKMGSKLLKSFRRLKKSKGVLPSVSEDEEVEDNETGGLQVSVPDNKRKLTEKDLIGDQIVQDIYRDLEASLESRSPDTVLSSQETTGSSERTTPTLPIERAASPMTVSTRNSDDDREGGEEDEEPSVVEESMINSLMSLLGGNNKDKEKQKDLPPEVRNIPDTPRLPVSKSWVDQFRLTLSEEDSTNATEQSWMKRNQEALDRQCNILQNKKNEQQRKKKQVWREATDPKSGRSYYYHRVTREVTWKKPQEMIDLENQQAEDEKNQKEAERRLMSVLSDGDLAAAAERDSKSEANELVRKKNERDFDPHVWAIKEQIVKLLKALSPPDGTSIEQILKQYEGREEILLHQLHDMKNARPFDEPVASDSVASTDDMSREEPLRSKSAPRMRPNPEMPRTNSNKASTTQPRKSKAENSNRLESKKAAKKKAEPIGYKPDPSTGAAESQKTNNNAPETKKTSGIPPRSKPMTKPAEPAAPLRQSAKDAAPEKVKATESRKGSSAKKQEKENHPAPNVRATPSSTQERDLYLPEALKNRVRTTGSGVTKVSEKTELIKNTAKGRNNTLNTVGEARTVGSDATSLSSTGLEPRVTLEMSPSPGPIPGKIVAPRTRELMVEEYATDRSYKAETYDKKRTVRAGRFGTTGTRRKPFTTPITNSSADGDESTKGTDSVSALSMDESKQPFVPPLPSYRGTKSGVDDARRRALDDAIRREDWDLAAALSDAMRSLKAKPPVQQPPTEWRQSELDRFISQNDWDAVANYIALVRASTKQKVEPPRTVKTPPPPAVSSQTSRQHHPPSPTTTFDEIDEIMDDNPTRRFGAKSQLQHNEINSESSWESEDSSYYSDDYSSASSYTEPSRRAKSRSFRRLKASLPSSKTNQARPKEFAC